MAEFPSKFQIDVMIASEELDTPYGTAIRDVLEGKYNKTINHGRLYPNLDRLVDNEFMVKQPIDKRTNRYALTSEGKEYLASRCDEIEGALTE